MSSSIPSRISALFLLLQFIVSGIFGISILQYSSFESYAAYTESDSDTYAAYKQKLEGALQDMERGFRVNGTITEADISNVRNLVTEAYNRLPDTPDVASKNETMRKSVELYLDLASKNKGSQTHVGNAISQTSRFLSEANIATIAGSIEANPIEGNAPLTVSFLGSAKDPSGVNIPEGNYIWWTRENGGYRRELGRGPTLTYTFTKEGNYQVFLDVVSGSRNKKGKTDVLPLSISKDITVKPRLGNIVLLLNGVNVSNIDSLKINPTLGKIGVIFDATASKALSNGTITKTKWDFGNGNTLEYPGSPIVERQIYALQGQYTISLEITNNQGQTFKKVFTLIVRDPSATITLDKDTVYIGEALGLSAKSYFGNNSTVEYTWTIQDRETGKTILSKPGSSLSQTFNKIGEYIVTLEARSANGTTDQDSKTITVESREPIVNLESPRIVSTEKPNTFIFDASRSFDPDTKSTKNLIYTWTIDGEKVTLDNTEKDGAVGTYTFTEKGSHTVTLTVANTYGKVKTIDKTFDVTSVLTIGINITPRAAPIGTNVNFQARSPGARFFEWNLGDGSPSINGTTDFVSHVYKKTGIYSVTLTVKNADGSESNTIERKVYVTDTNSPFALIDVRNGSGPAFENANLCGSGAFQINRAESSVIDGGNSINIDGSPSGLTYTWMYLDKVKTGPSLSEKFSELGCFPIDLTVKSDRNGATHTSRRYIQIENALPKITSIDTSIDTTKKDSQKLIVNVTANGARDEDGVITSYIWYYKTESDSEPQNVKITQSPKTTFVLPNISEKYTFGVILEDNDGARVNSADTLKDQSPLIITNDDGNINLPLISLTVPKTQLLTGEKAEFSVTAKNILGTDLTTKSEYIWDFDGDGKIDQKTTIPQTDHTYLSSGKYTMKVKVVYNGVSNTKYQVINVKNELKANVAGYRSGDRVYFMNISQGTYDRAVWKIGDRESESLYGIMTTASELTGNPILTVSAGNTESSSIEITPAMLETLSTGSGILVQSSLGWSGDTIHVRGRSDTLLISAFGNDATTYSIDTDTKIDSDLDGVGDNDSDNKNTPSYENGSAFQINLREAKIRKREIRVQVIKNGIVVGSRTISIILDYIPDSENIDTPELSGSGISSSDRVNLEKLQSKIRSFTSDDRIILTQYYTSLIENWDDLHDRTEWLLTIQKGVNDSPTLTQAVKDEVSLLLDAILVGDAQATNEVTVATRVIEGLIKSDDPDRAYITERLEQIKAHPANLSENKVLGREILEKLSTNTNVSTEDKLLIRSQLLVITSGGEESVSSEDKNQIIEEQSSGSGVLGFIKGVVWIFVIILAVILILFLIGYIFYRFSRQKDDIGFQDFLIDSIAHSKKPPQTTTSTPPGPSAVIPESDPLKEVAPIREETPLVIPVATPIRESTPIIKKTPIETPSIVVPLDPLSAHTESTPDEIPTEKNEVSSDIETAPMVDITAKEDRVSSPAIPDWLKPVHTETETKAISEELEPKVEEVSKEIVSPEVRTVMPEDSSSEEIIPDWLKAPTETVAENITTDIDTASMPLAGNSADTQDKEQATELPDWLRSSVEASPSRPAMQQEKKTPKKKTVSTKKSVSPKKTPETKSENGSEDIPDWLK